MIEKKKFHQETEAALSNLEEDLLKRASASHGDNIDASKTEQVVRTGSAENSPVRSSQDFTPKVGILEMEKEQTIKKLAAEIKRISWLDENTSGVEKVIPEIGLDLRASAINKMLREDHKLEPGTEKADEKMNELYEIWARQWMQALENQKKEKEGRRAASEPTSATRLAEPPAPVAGTAGGKKKEEITEPKLDEEREKIYQNLLIKANIQEMEGKLPKNEDGMTPAQKRDYKVKKIALIGMGKALKRIVRDFEEADIKYFRDGFMKQILDFYREEKKRASNRDEFRELKNKFREDISDVAKAKGFDKYKDEQGREMGVYYIVNYFNNLFNVEYILNE